MKKASIKDVAKLAGVSIATVSQILNGKGERFAESTREKVLAARDEIGYVPNFGARSLKKKHLLLIGVVVPTLSLPYFGDFVQRLQDNLPENVSLSIMSAELGEADAAVRTLVQSGVSGLIVVSQLQDPMAVAKELKQHGVGLVVLENNENLKEADIVYAKDVDGGRLAAEHLIAQGHKHVVLLGNQVYTDNLAYRANAFKQAATEAGIKLSEITTHSLTKQSGQAAAMAVSISRATATFALNDELAIGLISGLAKLDRPVPETMSVVGYDDSDYAGFYQPALTTIRQPLPAIAKASLDMILNRIQDMGMPRQVEAFDVTFVERRSTQAPE